MYFEKHSYNDEKYTSIPMNTNHIFHNYFLQNPQLCFVVAGSAATCPAGNIQQETNRSTG